MTARLYLRRLDYLLIAAVAAICALGWVTVESATRNKVPGSPSFYALRDAIYLGLGATVAVVVSLIDPKLYRRLSWWVYGATLGLLIVVLAIGSSEVRGSSRWIPLPFFKLQPSELAKVTMTVCIAAFVAERIRDHGGSWRLLALTLLIVAPPTALVFIEPDLGTSIVLGAVTLTILFVSGMRMLQFGTILAVLVSAGVLVFTVLPAVGTPVLHDYQTARLACFLHPSHDPSSACYQVAQAKIALGSGGLTGTGETAASQSTSGFLPEEYTDFIAAVVGEQRGFVGLALLLALYVVVFWRAVRSITLAASMYESLLAAGVAGMFITQIFVNIGMTAGIMPTTGIPLPFMTYGGSNTVVNLAAVGLLCAIQIRGGVPAPPPLAAHDSVVGARRRLRHEPATLVRR